MSPRKVFATTIDRWSRALAPGSKASRCDGWRKPYRTVTGAGSGGTTVGPVPGTPDIGGSGAAFGPGIGCAEAVAVDDGGEPPGITTTRVPTLTRSNRSETSSFSMPTQPDDTNLPMVDGWLVP